jgi:hypothetical protein
MRLFYKVFARVTGGFAARIGKSVFKSVWSRIDEAGDPPKPTRLDASLSKVVLGAALEATTMAVTAAIVERATASTFSYLFGVSPEPEPKEKKDKKSSS